MKKSISISLIFIFLFNTALYFFFLPVLTNRLKERFDEDEEKEQCEYDTIIEINGENRGAVIFAGEHELIVNGSMYDILKTETEGNTTKYYCYHDKEEESLEKYLLDKDKTKPVRSRSISNIMPLNIFLLPGTQTDYCITKGTLSFPIFIDNKIRLFYNEVKTPPPNC